MSLSDFEKMDTLKSHSETEEEARLFTMNMDEMDEQAPACRFFVMRNDDNEPILVENEEMLAKIDQVELSFSPADAPEEAAQAVDDPATATAAVEGVVIGVGCVQVTSKRVLWSQHEGDKVLDMCVAKIALHAITQDPAHYPRPSLYCQLDLPDAWEEEEKEEEEEEEEEGGAWYQPCLRRGEVFLTPVAETPAKVCRRQPTVRHVMFFVHCV